MKSNIQMSLIRTSIKKRVAWTYAYKLVCVDDKYSKSFKP